MKHTILFDLDGTLIDSTPAILDGFDTAFKAHGKNAPDHEKLKSLVGNPLEVMFAGLGAPQDLVQEYVISYKERYAQIYLEQTTLLPFAYEAIKLAADISDVGIVTTKTSKFSVNILENLGVMKFVKTLVGRDDVKRPKPDPEPIVLALTRIGKTSRQDKICTFMIGDTPMDMLAASAAEVNGLGLLCGYSSLEILKPHTKHIFDNPLEAVKFVQSLS